MHHKDGNSLGLVLSSESSQASTVFPSGQCVFYYNFFQNSCHHLQTQIDLQHGQIWSKKIYFFIFLQKSHMFNAFQCGLIFSNQKLCGNQQTFIASYSLQDSLKSVLLSKEICTAVPKKGKKWWGTKYVQRESQKYESKAVSLGL